MHEVINKLHNGFPKRVLFAGILAESSNGRELHEAPSFYSSDGGIPTH